jgi:hypothetical protein
VNSSTATDASASEDGVGVAGTTAAAAEEDTEEGDDSTVAEGFSSGGVLGDESVVLVDVD